jgi:hypothetical protein
MRQVPRKRRFPRVPLIAPVVVRRLGDNASEITRIMTLGLGGCMFESDKGWGVGSPLALLISLHGGRTVRSTGRVVYELLHADEPIRIGVEFLKLDPADRATLAVAVPGPSNQRC